MDSDCARVRFRMTAEQIEPMLVHAAQIATAERHAMAVEEFKDLDRDLATIVETVTKKRCGELAVRALGRDVASNVHHLTDRAAQEEVIEGNLVHLSHPAEQFQ